MVAVSGAVATVPSSSLAEGVAVDASIAAYLNAGERMQTLMDLTWKLCAVLAVLLLLAWAIGILPSAIRLF